MKNEKSQTIAFISSVKQPNINLFIVRRKRLGLSLREFSYCEVRMSSKRPGRRRKIVELTDWDQITKIPEEKETSWKESRDRSVETKSNHRKHERPLTENHIQYMQAIESHPVTICTGPAGCGKTSLACDVAARLFKSGEINKIVLTRPIVQCDEDLGTLPGDMNEKMNPYLAPLIVCLKESLGIPLYDKLFKSGVIQIVPLAIMRGNTYHDSIVILDESQNATAGQLRMFLTRMGHNSKMIINGDTSQSDINHKGGILPLFNVVEKLQGNKDIAIVGMERGDVLRPWLVQWIDEQLTT